LPTREGNHYIETGYRPTVPSVRDCLLSLTYIHNETGTPISSHTFKTQYFDNIILIELLTVNIFSHFIGAVIFFVIPFYVFTTEIPPRYAVATLADKIVCSAYFLGVAVCFLFSVG